MRALAISFIFLTVFSFGLPSAWAGEPSVTELKTEILRLAKSYEGKGDPDQSLQKPLDALVDKLVANSSMPPVSERIDLIAGAWKQVWGPYDYRDENGGVDPTLGFREIYQVVFADGYYYNVAPYFPGGDATKEQIGYLRGEFALDAQNKNGLTVKFTRYPGVKTRPSCLNLWDLPALSEAGKVENEITLVPTPIVMATFKGGTLDEVYTDEKLRLVYGTSFKPNARRFLYVMRRVE